MVPRFDSLSHERLSISANTSILSKRCIGGIRRLQEKLIEYPKLASVAGHSRSSAFLRSTDIPHSPAACLTMNPPCRRTAPILVVTLFAISSAFAAGERNRFNPQQFSTGSFHNCPATGNGSDPYLNSLKNRDKPPTVARLYTVIQLLNVLPKTLPNQKVHRDTWSAAQQDLAAKWESRAVMVEGYLLQVVQEGKEACNCGSTQYVDHHLWLAATPNSSRAQAMVVEVSPRAWPSHPSWSNNSTFQNVITGKSKVRVTGSLTWDQEHKEQLGKTRQTLWEVHPIHQIQVQRGNQWVNL